MQIEDLTVTYNTSTDDPLSLVAQTCAMAQITPESIVFGDGNVSIEFSNRDDAVRYTEEYLGSSENVSEYVP